MGTEGAEEEAQHIALRGSCAESQCGGGIFHGVEC